MGMIEGSGAGFRCPPGQHKVRIGVVGSWAGGAPFDGVDLFAVGLQVVDTRVLLHAPDLDGTHTNVSEPLTQIVLTQM